VTCLDVTPGGLAVSADTRDNLLIWQSNNGEVRVRFKFIHVSDIVLLHGSHTYLAFNLFL